MTRKLILAIAATAAVAAAPAYAGDIYRYTDDEGNVHYVDRPTGADDEQRLAITSHATNPAQVQARTATRYSTRDADTAESGDAAEEDRPSRAERAAEAKSRAQQCQKYRDQLESYVTSRRLYREDDKGERVYLDEKEVEEARAKTEELIGQYCK